MPAFVGGRSEFCRAVETQLYSQKELNVKSASSEDLNSKENHPSAARCAVLPQHSLSAWDNQNFWKNRFNRQSLPRYTELKSVAGFNAIQRRLHLALRVNRFLNDLAESVRAGNATDEK